MLIDMVVPSLSLAAGGPSRSIAQLSAALSAYKNTEVRLISQSLTASDTLSPRVNNIQYHVEDTTSKISLKLGMAGRRALRRTLELRTPSVIHSNGIWHPLNHWCANIAHRHSIPLVIQPRGMLQPWALSWHSNRKRVALALYQRRDLELAALLVATSSQEAENLRSFGLRQPIAVIPNGLDFRPESDTKVRGMNQVRGEPRRALFLGRIHPVKGIKNLLNAWSASSRKGWVLQLAGPDERGYLAEVFALAKQLKISDEVEYLGEFDDQAKWHVYANADLFVLPSFSENFGMVIAEALVCGLPVITTTGTPWQDLQTYDCGWWVPPTVEGLKGALSDALSCSQQQLIDMGGRGRVYVQRYSWADIAANMMQFYQWGLGLGPKPSCVRLD